MKSKKDKNNFDAIQNVTDKSKGLLKSTFGTLFTAIDKIYKKKSIKENQDVEEEYIEEKVYDSIPESIATEEPNFAYDDNYENKFITDIETEEREHIDINDEISTEVESKTIEQEENDEFVEEENIQCVEEENIQYKDHIILSYLEEQRKDIQFIKDEFNNTDVKNKRAVLITEIHNFLNKTINIDIDSLSLEDNMNKNLYATVILNNRLRSLRQILRKENKDISYYENVDESDIDVIINDAEHQIKMLKQEFIMEFYYDMDRYPESDDIMIEFSSIEYQIASKKRVSDINIKDKNIKMIVVDLDGTLLDSNKEISKETKEYLEDLKNKGYIITIATGRMYASAIYATEGAEFANYIITDNGAFIYDAKEEEPIFKNTISKDLVNECLKYYNENCSYIDVCDKNTVFMYSEEQPKHDFIKVIDDKEVILNECGDVGHMVIAMKNSEETTNVYNQLKNDIPTLDILLMQDSYKEDKWIDIMNQGCSKSLAVNRLADYLNLSNDEIIAFGDGANDIDMLEKCGYGVALKNALPEVKAVADDITNYDHNNNGVIEYLKEHLDVN